VSEVCSKTKPCSTDIKGQNSVESMPIDDYHTCRKTYATLRVYHKTANPSSVSRCLRIEPSSSQVAGKTSVRKGKIITNSISGWFFSSEDRIDSCDSAKHLRWLFAQLEGKIEQFEKLRSSGWWMDISCFWDSESGHGGPNLDSKVLNSLSRLGMDVWFDVYFAGALDYTKMVKKSFSTKANEA
jgi:hypothetical protein